MKIKVTMLLSVLFVASFSNAQTEEESSWNRLQKGDVLVDAYAGYPNWGVYNLTSYINGLGTSEMNSNSGIVPLGIKGEFFLSDEISFTLDASYTQWSGSWDATITEYDSLQQPTTTDIENSYNASRFSFQIGANYHIPDIESDNLDVYMGVGIGTNNISESLEREQPDFNAKEQNYFLSNGFFLTSSTLATTPLSFRLRVGGRYFFTNNVALNVEAGTGIRTILFGLTYRL